MIPRIDISPLFAGPSRARDAADAAIMEAAGDIGFLTVTGLPGNALSPETRRTMLSIFGLPETEKRKLYRWNFDPARPSVYRGWFPLQPGHPTYKEGIDMGPDAAHGPDRTAPGDPLTEPTPLPDAALLPGWHAAVRDYYLAMEATGNTLMRALARGLGLPEDRFAPAFARGISTLRLTRYPPRPPESFGDAGEALWLTHDGRRHYLLGAPHVDSGLITLLAQDGVSGLQAQARDGAWLTVPPAEGTLAVNFGRLLERWTGGRIRATVHRVIGSGIERHSIPFFYEPAVDAVIAPLEGVSGESFAPFSYGDYLWEVTTRFVEQKGIAHLRHARGVTAA